jgi:N-acetylglucosaminyldiphosphoundecaprenol N-acetyl-beta-D-mannosaminyltransferase
MSIENSWQSRWMAMIRKLRIITDAEQERQFLAELGSVNSPVVVGFLNAHAMNLLAGDRTFFDALFDADILLRDGSGMAMLYRQVGLAPGLNMNGTDLIPKILHLFHGKRVALWGTQEPFLTAATTQCANQFGVELVSRHHGFDPVDSYVQLAVSTQPDLIVLGMGMPKQEQVAAAIRQVGKPKPVVIVCGGAILDFLGGKVTRAPSWARDLGLEWLYRLLLEPKRLFKRYVVGNPVFLFRVLSLHKMK